MIDIPGYEGRYAVTSCGRVWSYKTKRFIFQETNDGGYKRVRLSKDGEQKNFRVARLVAEAYIPNPLGLPQVNHKDEIRDHDYVGNLEWVTANENMNYGTRNAKISKPVLCVELNKVFPSITAAAEYLGICMTGISNCITGRAKTCHKYHWQLV